MSDTPPSIPASVGHAAPPVPGIRERLAALPKVGQIVSAEADGIGTIAVKRLSYGQILDLPGELSGLHHVKAALVDEAGQPVFTDLDQIKALHPGAGDSLVRACLKVSSLDIQAAIKK